MFNALAEHSFAVRHWFLYFLWLLFAFGGIGVGLTVVWRGYKAQKTTPEPRWHRRWYTDLIVLGIAVFFSCLAFRGDIKNIEEVINKNDPMQCDLWKTPVVRMLSTSQWSRNQEGVTLTGCHFSPRLKVVVEQHVKGNALINPSIPTQLLNENQLVINVNRINWKDFQDGEIVITVIDPDKSPSWRGSIAELRAGQINSGRQLVTLSTRD